MFMFLRGRHSDDMPRRSQFLPEQHRWRKRTRRRKNGGYRIKFSFSNSSAADSQGETPPESSVQGNDAEDAVAELLSPGPNPAEDFDENQDLITRMMSSHRNQSFRQVTLKRSRTSHTAFSLN
eukprot:g17114.t1